MTTELKVSFLKDLPPDRRPRQRQRNWQYVADKLRANPHDWAVIGKVPRSTITRLRRGDYKDFRPVTDWEWHMKNLEEDPHSTTVILLGMFVGAPKPPTEEER